MRDKLRQAQELLRHQVSDGDIAEIFEKALDGLIESTKKKRFAATSRPRKTAPKPTDEADTGSGRSRHIPSAIKRAVVERDEGRCTYEDAGGRRCGETAFLQYHHIESFAGGGEHSVENITLRCAGHNRYAAELELGREMVEEKIRRAREGRVLEIPPGGNFAPGGNPRAAPAAGPVVEQLALVE
jgi:hypothetical protein